MPKYSCYNYEVSPTEVSIATSSEHEEYKTGYVFTIDGDDYDHDSDEWYETESEAAIAAEAYIDYLEEGPEYEMSYEERMALKDRSEIDWDERRRMGE